MSKKNDLEIMNLNLDDESIVASASEMTGLTPTPAKNAYEAESYGDLLPYQSPQNPSPAFPIIAPVGPANPREFASKFPIK